MGPLPAMLVKTLAPVIAGKLANAVARKKYRSKGDQAPEHKDLEPIVDVREIERIIEEGAKEPEVAKVFEPKHWTRSRGVVAGLVVSAISGAGLFGTAFEAGDVTEVLGHVDKIIVGVLGLVAAYGRWKARTPIK